MYKQSSNYILFYSDMYIEQDLPPMPESLGNLHYQCEIVHSCGMPVIRKSPQSLLDIAARIHNDANASNSDDDKANWILELSEENLINRVYLCVHCNKSFLILGSKD